MFRVAQRLERAVGPIDLVFGHNDLLAANFMDDGARLWLVDWDYAGWNTPLFDLGGLSSNNGLDAPENEALLADYFGEPATDSLWRRFQAMVCASLLRESMWSMVSELRSTIAFDYVAYTEENLQTFRDRLRRIRGNGAHMTDLPNSAQVIVVGGGIVGCSVAYHLAKRGVEVLLLERHQLTSGSTWHAAGLVGQLRTSANITRLLGYSVELYGKLEAETGLATGWKRNGGLRLACNADRWIEVKRQADDRPSFGLEMHLLATERGAGALAAHECRRRRRRRIPPRRRAG